MMWTGEQFEPGTPLEGWYRKVNSPILPYVERIGPAYIRVLSKALSAYQGMGYKVVHIPFTPEDSLFAKIHFQSQTENFLPYSPNVTKVVGRISECDLLLSTRYHSLVFGIKCQVPTIPILYADKCADLLADLGVKEEGRVNRVDLVDETDSCIDQLVNGDPIWLDSDRLAGIEAEVRRGIQEAYQVIER